MERSFLHLTNIFRIAVSSAELFFHSGDERTHSSPSLLHNKCILDSPSPYEALFPFLSHFQCTDHLYYCHNPCQVPQIHKYQLLEHIIHKHSVA